MKNSYKDTTPRIGEIYLMYFSGNGSEQCGWRPGLVFQNNVGNTYSPNIIALPLTTSLKKMGQPTHIFLPAKEVGLRKDSLVLCENPQRMTKSNIGKYITTLSDEYMSKVAAGNLLSSSAISFINLEELISLWEKAVSLNNVTQKMA